MTSFKMATSNEIRIIVSQYYTTSGCLCTTFLLGAARKCQLLNKSDVFCPPTMTKEKPNKKEKGN